MKKILGTVALSALLASTLSAGGNSNTGCGLGSMIIPNQNTVLTQVAAVITNGTSGNQTFGITSGSLNCDKPAKIALNEKTERFVAENMDTIAVDVAAGEGESLDTLLSMLKVEDKSAVSAKLKANFASIYASENVTSAQVIDSISASL